MSYFILYVFFFFFSSRRRHTRWPRDWSSDVCSSDLGDDRQPDTDDFLQPREAQRRPIGMGGGWKHRPYQKIVGAAGVRGLRLPQVVHRLADPPSGVQAARVLGLEASLAQLDPRCAGGKRHIEAVIHEQE